MKKKQMSRVKQTLICLAITLVVGLVYFISSCLRSICIRRHFIPFVFILCAVYCVCAVFTSRIGLTSEERQLLQVTGFREFFRHDETPLHDPFFPVSCANRPVFGGSLFSSVILRSGSYTKLLTVEQGDFAADVEEISFDQIPMLDKDSRLQAWRPKTGSFPIWSASLKCLTNTIRSITTAG